jgi:hypothetical protein
MRRIEMNKKIVSTLSFLLIVFMMSCNLSTITGGSPAPVVDSQATEDVLVAQAAEQTATQMALESQLPEFETETAVPPPPEEQPAEELPTPTPEPVLPTETPEPTITLAFTDTPMPTITPLLASPTPFRTQTPMVSVVNPPSAPVVNPTQVPCNAARFISDVTVKDRTVFAANSSFTKTWRIKNTGTCTWTSSYDVVFVDGHRMGAAAVVDLPAKVEAGEEVEIKISMVAPESMGTYKGNWKLRDDKGVTFGVGGSSAPFYVEIIVNTSATLQPANYIYDFAGKFCSAVWTSGAGTLGCPGSENDASGFVLRIHRPQLETGQIDDEPGLITNPQAITDGTIRGTFPALRVEAGYHFYALIGCEFSAKNCNVKFQLDYQIADAAIQTLASWTETNDGNYQIVDVDLSSLADKDVKFILTVLAHGDSNQDRALWLAPRIDLKQ